MNFGGSLQGLVDSPAIGVSRRPNPASSADIAASGALAGEHRGRMVVDRGPPLGRPFHLLLLLVESGQVPHDLVEVQAAAGVGPPRRRNVPVVLIQRAVQLVRVPDQPTAQSFSASSTAAAGMGEGMATQGRQDGV